MNTALPLPSSGLGSGPTSQLCPSCCCCCNPQDPGGETQGPSTFRDEAFTEPGTEGPYSLQEEEEEREEEGKIFGKEGDEGEAQAALALPCPSGGLARLQVTKPRAQAALEGGWGLTAYFLG